MLFFLLSCFRIAASGVFPSGWVTDIDTLDSMLVRFYYVLLFLGSLLVTPIPILLARVTIGWCLTRQIFDLMDMTIHEYSTTILYFLLLLVNWFWPSTSTSVWGAVRTAFPRFPHVDPHVPFMSSTHNHATRSLRKPFGAGRPALYSCQRRQSSSVLAYALVNCHGCRDTGE